MALFLDTFVNRIDRKGRVSVPAPFRAVLEGQKFHGLIALPSFKSPAIECAGIDWMERINANLGQIDLFSDSHDDLTATLFPDAKRIAFDGEGRVVLPEALTRHAQIADVAAFVGRGERFEIWQPAAFETYRAAARQRALQQGRTLPQRPGGER